MCPKNVLAPSFMILPHVTLLPPPPSFSGRKKSKKKQNKTKQGKITQIFLIVGLKKINLKRKKMDSQEHHEQAVPLTRLENISKPRPTTWITRVQAVKVFFFVIWQKEMNHRNSEMSLQSVSLGNSHIFRQLLYRLNISLCSLLSFGP